jgi:hypothetical protein
VLHSPAPASLATAAAPTPTDLYLPTSAASPLSSPPLNPYSPDSVAPPLSSTPSLASSGTVSPEPLYLAQEPTPSRSAPSVNATPISSAPPAPAASASASSGAQHAAEFEAELHRAAHSHVSITVAHPSIAPTWSGAATRMRLSLVELDDYDQTVLLAGLKVLSKGEALSGHIDPHATPASPSAVSSPPATSTSPSTPCSPPTASAPAASSLFAVPSPNSPLSALGQVVQSQAKVDKTSTVRYCVAHVFLGCLSSLSLLLFPLCTELSSYVSPHASGMKSFRAFWSDLLSFCTSTVFDCLAGCL